MTKEDITQVLTLAEEYYRIKVDNEHKLDCIDYILSKFRPTDLEKSMLPKQPISNEAMKFFFMAVEDARLRTDFYNRVHRDLDKCLASEANLITYMNNKLILMRKLGYDNVPENIPIRQLRYPIKQESTNTYYFR